MCDRWRNSFEEFLADMGERPEGKTLDRIDGNGDYDPDNCRWATHRMQGRNRRSTNLVQWRGKTLTISEVANIEGLARTSLGKRFRALGDIDAAVSDTRTRSKKVA
jgi:hypothetical protein